MWREKSLLPIKRLSMFDTKERPFFTTRAINMIIIAEEGKPIYIIVLKVQQHEFVNLFKTPARNHEKGKGSDQSQVAMEDIDIKRSEDLINLR